MAKQKELAPTGKRLGPVELKTIASILDRTVPVAVKKLQEELGSFSYNATIKGELWVHIRRGERESLRCIRLSGR